MADHVDIDLDAVDMPRDEHVDVATRTFQLLSDPTRLRILWALLHGEHYVGDLARLVGAQPAAVSQQLAKLRWAGIVSQRREGNRIYYAAQDVHVRQLMEEALYHADHVSRGLPDHARHLNSDVA